jgi:hypothetical protein
MDLEKIKQKIANFDMNSAIATAVATVGSMNTEGIANLVYLVLATITTLATLVQSSIKNRRDNEMKIQEIKLKEVEVQSKRIDNELKQQGFHNEPII